MLKAVSIGLVGACLMTGSALAQAATAANEPAQPAANSDAATPPNATTVNANTVTVTPADHSIDWSARKLIGKSVKNKTNETVGTVDDLLLSPDGKVSSIIIGVGGFLGMGEKRVAEPFEKLQNGGTSPGVVADYLVMDVSKNELSAAPDWKPPVQPKS